MVMRAQALAEPIPGYKLIERLGGGGFGEVWKCEAPGGLLKAIKFVHGNLHGTHDAGVHQELKSLNRVKTVRHPYILSLERFDIVDGQLVIVMELADRNLWDRFQECRNQGLVGIPRPELLGYMVEAAEALDLMNIQYQLQHLDIKPQNLFLVHNHVKVADFGLVKDLEGMNAQVSSGVTPVYAAPETFEGTVSRYSDQYNLAIVYQELLTGQRPFAGTNVRQLLMQHLTGTPDLNALPPCDRAAMTRALSKKPEERFPSCMDLVQALRTAGQGGAIPEIELTASSSVSETPAVIRVSPTARIEPKPAPTPPPVPRGSVTLLADRKPAIPPFEEVTGTGVLFPALVVGLGGLGVDILEGLRKGLNSCAASGAMPHLRLLGIESDAEAATAVHHHPDAALTSDEVMVTPIEKPAHYLKVVRNRAVLDSWLNLSMLCRIPRHQTTPAGLRILGRLALVDNYRTILARLKAELQTIGNPKSLVAADRQTRLGVRTNRPRVYIVANLSGGTGSGMFLDMAYIVRHLLMLQGHKDPDVVGVLLLPSATPASKNSAALGNAYTALTELHHFSAQNVTYQAFFDEQEDPLQDSGAPFSRCVVVPLPDEGQDPRTVTAAVADALARELVTPLGRTIDEERAALLHGETDAPGTVCQTFGAYRFAVPRRQVVDQVGRALSRRLVASWLNADRIDLKGAVKDRLASAWRELNLEPEALMARLAASCEAANDKHFDAILDGTLGANGEVETTAALSALGQLEQLVGRSGEDRAGPTNLAHAFAKAAATMCRDAQDRLGELLAGMVEDPRFRIAGAEDAVLQIGSRLVEADREHRRLAQEKVNEAAAAHDQIHALIASARKGSWWPGRKTKLACELRDALKEYPRLRCQALLLTQIRAVYQDLREMLPRHQEAIHTCRQRVGDLLRSLETGRKGKPVDLGFGEHFLPIEARTFEEAVDKLATGVKADDLLALDQKTQPAIRKQFKSLAHLCHSAGTNFHDVGVTLRQQAEEYAEGLLGKSSAASLYLRDNPPDAEVCADLSRAFDEAMPALGGSRAAGPELRLLAVPADPAGQRLAKLAPAALDGVHILSGGDDVFFYREQPRLPLADLPQLGLLAEQVYRQMTSANNFTPHTRMDVLHWELP